MWEESQGCARSVPSRAGPHAAPVWGRRDQPEEWGAPVQGPGGVAAPPPAGWGAPVFSWGLRRGCSSIGKKAAFLHRVTKL